MVETKGFEVGETREVEIEDSGHTMMHVFDVVVIDAAIVNQRASVVNACSKDMKGKSREERQEIYTLEAEKIAASQTLDFWDKSCIKIEGYVLKKGSKRSIRELVPAAHKLVAITAVLKERTAILESLKN